MNKVKVKTNFHVTALTCFLVNLYCNGVLAHETDISHVHIKPASTSTLNPEQSERLKEVQADFEKAWKRSPEAQGIINNRCGESWYNSVTESNSENQMDNYFKNCSQILKSDQNYIWFKSLRDEFGVWGIKNPVPYNVYLGTNTCSRGA